MSTIEVSELLRPGLLRGTSVLVAGYFDASADAGESLGSAVEAACATLGARVSRCPLDSRGGIAGDSPDVGEVIDGVLARAASLELLAVDAASLFASAVDESRGGRTALGACLDASWNVTRAVAERAFLADGRGGRVVYLAPAPDAGEHADAARAGLENLARTLSIEWARHSVTAVAIAPGSGADAPSSSAAATASEVGALTAYLASPAGAYFSGCLFDLRGPAGE
jgi:NAD(P)-dependent dehydrogenase (short-subunit alcohol dehydrogenase family)